MSAVYDFEEHHIDYIIDILKGLPKTTIIRSSKKFDLDTTVSQDQMIRSLASEIHKAYMSTRFPHLSEDKLLARFPTGETIYNKTNYAIFRVYDTQENKYIVFKTMPKMLGYSEIQIGLLVDGLQTFSPNLLGIDSIFISGRPPQEWDSTNSRFYKAFINHPLTLQMPPLYNYIKFQSCKSNLIQGFNLSKYGSLPKDPYRFDILLSITFQIICGYYVLRKHIGLLHQDFSFRNIFLCPYEKQYISYIIGKTFIWIDLSILNNNVIKIADYGDAMYDESCVPKCDTPCGFHDIQAILTELKNYSNSAFKKNSDPRLKELTETLGALKTSSCPDILEAIIQLPVFQSLLVDPKANLQDISLYQIS